MDHSKVTAASVLLLRVFRRFGYDKIGITLKENSRPIISIMGISINQSH